MSIDEISFGTDAATARRRRRGAWLGGLSVAALLLHAVALSGLQWSWPQAEALRLPAAMLVRVVDATPPTAPLVEAASEAPVERVIAEPLAAPAPPAAITMKAAPATARAPTVPARPNPLAIARVKATPAMAEVPLVAAPAPAPAADEAIPPYRTRMPPPTTLRYAMSRGMLSGIGELSWRPQGDRYELKLEGRVGGLALLTQSSSGGFDAAGLAPLRFTDQRLRRGTLAANFQRAAGKITFSGPSTEIALRAGSQDRLSWMVQLAAIVAANPPLRAPGAKVVIHVVGANGDASVWVFRCIGAEVVETRAGAIDAIKYLREPREPYDTTVQVWLDPRQHDLPVHATQKSGPNDEGFDLRLQEVLP